MALIKCAECGKDVSSEAKTCPHCGAKVVLPKKPMSKTKKIIFGALGGVILISIVATNQQEQEKAQAEQARLATLSPEQKAQEEAHKAQQEKYEEMAKQGARKLKLAMKDPESFEIKSLIVKKNGTACYDYRATNSFNAKLQYSAVLTTIGEIFSQEHQPEKFRKVWNKDCTQPGGVDLTNSSNLKRWLKN